MIIINRVKNIVSGSINDILDKLEDSESIIKQIVRDMEQAYSQCYKNTASSVATVKMIEKKIANHKKEQECWSKNAEVAVKKGNDDLALKAIAKRREQENIISLLSIQLKDSEELSAKMQGELVTLRQKIFEMKNKRDLLVAKKRMVETKKSLYRDSGRMKALIGNCQGHNDTSGLYDNFEKYEDKIDRQMIELDAMAELRGSPIEQDVKKMNDDMNLEKDLKALKEAVL